MGETNTQHRLAAVWIGVAFILLAIWGSSLGRSVTAAVDLPGDMAGYYYDGDDVLSTATIARIKQINWQLMDTPNAPEIAVATLVDADEDIDQLAADLYKAWNVGQGKKDVGVLIMTNNLHGTRCVKIEVGNGLASVLSSTRIGDILDANRQLLQSKDPDTVDKGLRRVFDRVAKAVIPAAGENKPAIVQRTDALIQWLVKLPDWIMDHLVLSILMAIGLVVLRVVIAIVLRMSSLRHREKTGRNYWWDRPRLWQVMGWHIPVKAAHWIVLALLVSYLLAHFVLRSIHWLNSLTFVAFFFGTFFLDPWDWFTGVLRMGRNAGSGSGSSDG